MARVMWFNFDLPEQKKNDDEFCVEETLKPLLLH